MRRYILKRLLQLIPVLLGVTFLSFAMMRLAGSDAITELYGDKGAVSQEIIDAKRAELGLDRPFLSQYFSWLGGLLTGDMGTSYVSGRDVFGTFVSKLPATLLLTALSVAATVLLSVPLGILAAVRRDRFTDYFLRFCSFIGNALPNFFVALLLMQVFSIRAAPAAMSVKLEKAQDLRYGENPHQAAAVYRFDAANAPLFSSEAPLVGAEQLQGKPLSYNNFLDAEAAWNAVRELDEPGVVILKHQNPCGSAVAADVTEAYDRAFACDPKSAFGGIVAVNREVPLSLVEHFADRDKLFVEVLIAPSFTPEALERLSKRANLRVLATGGAAGHAKLEMRTVDGGMLVQRVDTVEEDPATFTFPTERKPTDAEMRDLMFAWKVCKTVKSNAILIAKNEMGIGMGPGQPNRVDSALLACRRADEVCERLGQEAGGYACASDAFFPFRDNVDTLAAHGVTAIIQPGGSVRDEESIDACNEHGIAMVFTGTRHFRH